MELYTVELENAHIVSRFEGNRKVGETTTLLKQTIRDLPYTTAKMYLDTDTTGRTKIYKQDAPVGAGRRTHEVQFGDVKSSRSKRPEPTTLKAASPAARPAATKKHEAAATGDLTAAINRS
jgi:hypothetical protein